MLEGGHGGRSVSFGSNQANRPGLGPGGNSREPGFRHKIGRRQRINQLYSFHHVLVRATASQISYSDPSSNEFSSFLPCPRHFTSGNAPRHESPRNSTKTITFVLESLLNFRALKHTLGSTLNSQVLGRTVKNEYLALSVFGVTFGSAYLATRGGKTAQAKPTTVQEAKETVPIKAASS